jgi:hypothetical protein
MHDCLVSHLPIRNTHVDCTINLCFTYHTACAMPCRGLQEALQWGGAVMSETFIFSVAAGFVIVEFYDSGKKSAAKEAKLTAWREEVSSRMRTPTVSKDMHGTRLKRMEGGGGHVAYARTRHTHTHAHTHTHTHTRTHAHTHTHRWSIAHKKFKRSWMSSWHPRQQQKQSSVPR